MIAITAWEFCGIVLTVSLCISVGFIATGINGVLRAKAAKLRGETPP